MTNQLNKSTREPYELFELFEPYERPYSSISSISPYSSINKGVIYMSRMEAKDNRPFAPPMLCVWARCAPRSASHKWQKVNYDVL